MMPDQTPPGGDADERNRLAALPLFATPAAPVPGPVGLHAVPPVLDQTSAAWQPKVSPLAASPSPPALSAAAVWHPTAAGQATPAAVPAPTGEVDWARSGRSGSRPPNCLSRSCATGQAWTRRPAARSAGH